LLPEELIKSLNGTRNKGHYNTGFGQVGTSAGIDKYFLKKMAGLSTHSIIAGGGIKDLGDIEALKESGIDGALVATALHNGKYRLILFIETYFFITASYAKSCFPFI